MAEPVHAPPLSEIESDRKGEAMPVREVELRKADN